MTASHRERGEKREAFEEEPRRRANGGGTIEPIRYLDQRILPPARQNLDLPPVGAHARAVFDEGRLATDQRGGDWDPRRQHGYARHRSENSERCCGCRCDLRIGWCRAHAKCGDVDDGRACDRTRRQVIGKNLCVRKDVERCRCHAERTLHQRAGADDRASHVRSDVQGVNGCSSL